MGPTVLGEVMAAGNLIWASPPYLFDQQSSRFECVNDRRSLISPTPCPSNRTEQVPEEGSGGPLRNLSVTGRAGRSQDQRCGAGMLLLQGNK